MLCQPKLLLRIRPCQRHGRTSSVAYRRHLPLEGKASLRIKILCQYNKGKAKLHSDHRNATSRQRSPQGRVRSTLGQHNKGSVKMNSDHQNSFSRQTPRAAAANAPRRGGNILPLFRKKRLHFPLLRIIISFGQSRLPCVKCRKDGELSFGRKDRLAVRLPHPAVALHRLYPF